ncbi:MAG: hypothetical protein ACKO0Z_23000 [Betaproteobacteria bacterium]
MNPIHLIPAPYRIIGGVIAVLLVVVVIFSAGLKEGALRVQSEWDKAKAEQAQSALAAEQQNREAEKRMNQKLKEAQDAANQREKKLRADYDAAHAAANGLRDAVAAARSELPGNTLKACRATADTALELFGECAGKYQEVAAEADGHASDSMTLSAAWP